MRFYFTSFPRLVENIDYKSTVLLCFYNSSVIMSAQTKGNQTIVYERKHDKNAKREKFNTINQGDNSLQLFVDQTNEKFRNVFQRINRIEKQNKKSQKFKDLEKKNKYATYFYYLTSAICVLQFIFAEQLLIATAIFVGISTILQYWMSREFEKLAQEQQKIREAQLKEDQEHDFYYQNRIRNEAIIVEAETREQIVEEKAVK